MGENFGEPREMCIDSLQVHRALGKQCLGVQIDPEKRAAFVDEFPRDFSALVQTAGSGPL